MTATKTGALFLTFGGVVCGFDPNRRLRSLSAITGLSPDRINSVVWEAGLDERAESGEVTPNETWIAVIGALDYRLDRLALRRAWSAAFVPNTGVCRLVSQVRGVRYCFTNNGPIVTDCLLHELRPIDDLFDRVVCSWELGACKPDPDAFQFFADEIEVEPAEITLVDDSKPNCLAAESIGIRTIHFADEESLGVRLRGFKFM